MARFLFTIDTKKIDAVLFDLDGVVTKTARRHSEAWKVLFDGFLLSRATSSGETVVPFTDDDYRLFVDGVPRYNGIQSFLRSREIEVPYGNPEDSSEEQTVCGLGNKKNLLFRELLRKNGVEVYESTISLIHRLRDLGIKIAVVTSSKNSSFVLEAAHIADLFEVCVDGKELERLGLSGKPEPDMFVEACERLATEIGRTIVIEDAISGVEAAKKGGFVVIGVNRANIRDELLSSGADVVVDDLAEIGVASTS